MNNKGCNNRKDTCTDEEDLIKFHISLFLKSA